MRLTDRAPRGMLLRLTATMALLAAVASCGAAPPDTTAPPQVLEPTVTTPPPGTGTGPHPTLQEYRDACEQAAGEEGWRAGQIDYPGRMSLGLAESASYQAAVDIRNEPLPPEQVIDASSPKSKPVLVRCILSARLDPVGEALEVSADTEGLGGWHSREFSPSGVTEWTWTVRAATPGHHELRLTLRPITTEQDLLNNIPVEQKSFTTVVEVDASFVQGVAHWFDTQFTALKAVFVSIGAVLLGALGFITNVGDQVRKLRDRSSRRRAKPSPKTPET